MRELQRSGAFERSVLVLVTPTGTGWIDPAAMNAVEYLHHGDIASVALQYSYLNSPLALLVEADYGRDVARALFAEIYGYWTELPAERRPRLYLHGLSLGALHSQRSWELHELLGDPIHGALWSGPPFRSDLWRTLTDSRDPDSPEWRPRFRDGRFVRFMNQQGTAEPADAPWGRCVCSTCSTPAIRSPSSTIATPGAAPTGWPSRAGRMYRRRYAGSRWLPCCSWRWTWR